MSKRSPDTASSNWIESRDHVPTIGCCVILPLSNHRKYNDVKYSMKAHVMEYARSLSDLLKVERKTGVRVADLTAKHGASIEYIYTMRLSYGG
jgi:hypothetical protein